MNLFSVHAPGLLLIFSAECILNFSSIVYFEIRLEAFSFSSCIVLSSYAFHQFYVYLSDFLLQIARAALVPETSYIAKPAASWLDDFLVWISPEAFGCCRKFTNGTFCPPDDQVCHPDSCHRFSCYQGVVLPFKPKHNSSEMFHILQIGNSILLGWDIGEFHDWSCEISVSYNKFVVFEITH